MIFDCFSSFDQNWFTLSLRHFTACRLYSIERMSSMLRVPPMGLHTKTSDDQIYCPTFQSVFPDEDGTLRCGRITFCTQRKDKTWVAMTGRWLFTKSWDPSTSAFDKNDEIMNKECWVGRWTGTRRADVTHVKEDIIGRTIRVGKVVALVHPFAVILMDSAFVTSKVFREQGMWATVDKSNTLFEDKQNAECCMFESSSDSLKMTVIDRSRVVFKDIDELTNDSDSYSLYCLRHLFSEKWKIDMSDEACWYQKFLFFVRLQYVNNLTFSNQS